jgi:hypothetical protein
MRGFCSDMVGCSQRRRIYSSSVSRFPVIDDRRRIDENSRTSRCVGHVGYRHTSYRRRRRQRRNRLVSRQISFRRLSTERSWHTRVDRTHRRRSGSHSRGRTSSRYASHSPARRDRRTRSSSRSMSGRSRYGHAEDHRPARSRSKDRKLDSRRSEQLFENLSSEAAIRVIVTGKTRSIVQCAPQSCCCSSRNRISSPCRRSGRGSPTTEVDKYRSRSCTYSRRHR